MVKIERKKTEKSELAILSLAKEKANSSGKCNTAEVVDALIEMFHGKCYICEYKDATSWEVEHLKPYGGDIDLKFDWNNLFWACGHCNHIKGNKFTPILDCTKVEIDEIIAFRKVGYFGVNESLTFEVIDDTVESTEIKMTCDLLQRVYYGKTAQEKIGAKMLRHALRVELTKFKNYVRDYNEASGEAKHDLFCVIEQELKSHSSFAAFKRWIVRDNNICRNFVNCWKKF